MDEEVRVGVLGEVRNHRTDDGQIIHAAGHVREEVADRNAALPVLAEFPWRLQHGTDIVELRRRHFHFDRLAMFLRQPRLGIKRIDLRRAAVDEQEDHVLRLRAEMRRPRHKQIGARRRTTGRAVARLGQERGQGHCTKAIGALPQHLPACQRCREKVSAVHGRPSVNEDELLDVEQHVAEIAPNLGVADSIIALALLLKEVQGLGHFAVIRRPAECRHVQVADAFPGRLPRLL